MMIKIQMACCMVQCSKSRKRERPTTSGWQMDQEVKEDNSTLERYLIARETPEVVFWQQWGAIRATSPPSLKTCGHRVISTFFLYISFM